MMRSPFSAVSFLLAAALALSACQNSAKTPETHGDAHDDHATEEAHAKDAEGHDDAHEDGHASGNVVAFSQEAQKQVAFRVEAASLKRLDAGLVVSGEVAANTDREAHVSPRVPGRVVRIAKTVGDRVRAGEALAVIESLELGHAQSEFLEAQARYELAQSTVKRQQALFKDDLAAEKEVIEAQSQLRLAGIALEKTRNQLTLFGYTPDRISGLSKRRRIDPTVPVQAPTTGMVVARHLTLGEMLDPKAAEPAFTLADMSELWVNANLYEKDLAQVRVGQAATVTVSAYPETTYKGRVSLISPSLDPTSRTAHARIVVANGDRRLKPAMFASVRIASAPVETLAIPVSAVQQEKQEVFAFVQKGPETFEKRPLKVGPKAGEFLPVVSGLQPGERVVVEGAFTLKSELLKESFGEHHH